MNFSEQPPSQQWAVLKYRGESLAGVWFKPEGEPFALRLRIPRKSFQLPGIGQQLTLELLLRAVGISTEEVESWRNEGDPNSDANESHPELSEPLPPPPPDVAYLDLSVSMKPPQPLVAPAEAEEMATPEAMWQYLDTRWEAILSVESNVDLLRSNMDGLRSELEAAASKSLPLEEKVNALSADVVLWNKAKSRVRYALPKLREFIHRATWATGAAERKTAEEHFTNHVQPRIPSPRLDRVRAEFDNLLKNRQILAAQGTAVYQECKRILGDVESALRTLQRNSVANAARKRGETGRKGKFS